MPTRKQIDWLKRHVAAEGGPILDVGGRVPETKPGSKADRQDLRDAFPDRRVVGLDMQEGEGVDVVLDLQVQRSKPALFRAVGTERGFETVACLSVLEHCLDLFKVAANIEKLVAPGGWLFVSVPWVWRYHAHPGDYWRLSPDAVRFLFRGLEYSAERSEIWTGAKEKTVADMDATRAYVDRERKTLRTVTINCAFQRGA
jgi:hypothetical protein